MAAPSGFTRFGPDPHLDDLEPAFKACLNDTLSAASRRNCDELVGQWGGSGFCSQPKYAQTTYCACVNNLIPCPMVAAAACANAAFSYRTSRMQEGGIEYKECKGQPICVNLVEIGGSQNVVGGITQQCGTIQNIKNLYTANPKLAVIFFILLVALIITMSMKTDDLGATYVASEHRNRRLEAAVAAL
jgi:hypothetical protein